MNDNYADEEDLMRGIAKTILKEKKPNEVVQCSLINGGRCPLLGGVVNALQCSFHSNPGR